MWRLSCVLGGLHLTASHFYVRARVPASAPGSAQESLLMTFFGDSGLFGHSGLLLQWLWFSFCAARLVLLELIPERVTVWIPLVPGR
jgi:hypothetical protein